MTYLEENICGWCDKPIFRRGPDQPWKTVWVESCDTASCARPDGSWVSEGHDPANTAINQ